MNMTTGKSEYRSHSQMNSIRVSEASIVTVQIKNKAIYGHKMPKTLEGSFVQDEAEIEESKKLDDEEIVDSPIGFRSS